jgi:hypothetical protein
MEGKQEAARCVEGPLDSPNDHRSSKQGDKAEPTYQGGERQAFDLDDIQTLSDPAR